MGANLILFGGYSNDRFYYKFADIIDRGSIYLWPYHILNADGYAIVMFFYLLLSSGGE